MRSQPVRQVGARGMMSLLVLSNPHDASKPFNYLGKGAELQLADLELVTLVGLLCLQNRTVNGLILFP